MSLPTLDLINDDTPMRDVRSLVGMMVEELQAAMLILLLPNRDISLGHKTTTQQR